MLPGKLATYSETVQYWIICADDKKAKRKNKKPEDIFDFESLYDL